MDLMDLIDDLIYYTFRFAVSQHSASLIWHEDWVWMEGAQYPWMLYKDVMIVGQD